jgi:hypothetical protein
MGYYQTAVAANPNVILIHAGTNDMRLTRTDDDIAQSAKALEHLLDQTKKHTPDALLVVAQICPVDMARENSTAVADYDERIKKYNQHLQKIVERKARSGWRILSAPIHDSLDKKKDIGTLERVDGIHPNEHGYTKMANIWYETLKTADSKNWIGEMGLSNGHGSVPCEAGAKYRFYNLYGTTPYPGTDSLSRPSKYEGFVCRDSTSTPDACLCSDGGSETIISRLHTKTRSCNEMASASISAVKFADLNGDGKDDYIWLGANGELHSALSGPGAAEDWGIAHPTFFNQSGVFSPSEVVSRSEVRLADLNGDNRADYIRVEPNGRITAWYNNEVYSQQDTQPQANFTQPTVIFSGRSGSKVYPGAGLQFADLDGDNRADLVYIGTDGEIIGFKNLGVSSPDSVEVRFGPPVLLKAAAPDYTRETVVLSDMNGDGRADIIHIDRSQNGQGRFKFFPNTGPGYTGLATFLSSPIVADADFSPVAPGEGVHFADPAGLGRSTFIYVSTKTSSAYGWYASC